MREWLSAAIWLFRLAQLADRLMIDRLKQILMISWTTDNGYLRSNNSSTCAEPEQFA